MSGTVPLEEVVAAVAWCRLGSSQARRPTTDAAFGEALRLGLLRKDPCWEATPEGEGALIAAGRLEGRPSPPTVRLIVLWAQVDGYPPQFVTAFTESQAEHFETEYARQRQEAESWYRQWAPGAEFFETVERMSRRDQPAAEEAGEPPTRAEASA